MKIILAVAAAVLLPLLAIGGAYALSLHSLSSSQHNWCATLSLLTSAPVPKPADPKANPSRENAWVFYVHLKDLEREFGC